MPKLHKSPMGMKNDSSVLPHVSIYWEAVGSNVKRGCCVKANPSKVVSYVHLLALAIANKRCNS